METTTQQIAALAALLDQIGASSTVTATIADDDGYGTTVTRHVLGPSRDGRTIRLAPAFGETVARVRGLCEVSTLTVNGQIAYEAEQEAAGRA